MVAAPIHEASRPSRPSSAPAKTGRFLVGFGMTKHDDSGPVSGDQLAELDRLRTASLLAGGLAHEVANPLLVVLANLAESERVFARLRASVGPTKDPRWESLADSMDQARRAAESIADVVRDFQVFLRPASNRVERLVEPAPLVARAVRMASPRIGMTAKFRSSIEKTPAIKAAPSFITQIALNLLTNASEAVAGLDPKQARIEVRLTQDGPNVVLEVEDNGPGLSAEDAANVFEPHATSKTSGTSLGLGLSICRALAERLGGSISLESVPNERTCFRVTLPIAAEAGVPDSAK